MEIKTELELIKLLERFVKQKRYNNAVLYRAENLKTIIEKSIENSSGLHTKK